MRQMVYESIFEVLDDINESWSLQLLHDATQYFFVSYNGLCSKDTIEECINQYYRDTIRRKEIQAKLERLDAYSKRSQRTEEWYQTRHNMITASGVWKILKSPKQRNTYINEKCAPLKIWATSSRQPRSLRWGVRYETLSMMIYERRNDTHIEQFTCIPHSRYSFLGASPDGIVVDLSSPKYGTMIEIKNVINRNITGFPKPEYWMQMQVQMEVCDMETCDFVETRFLEYATMEEWLESHEFGCERGVMVSGEGEDPTNNVFHICPENETPQDWVCQLPFRQPVVFWTLNKYSCVSVARDRDWFLASISAIEDAWNEIVERRAVKKIDFYET